MDTRLVEARVTELRDRLRSMADPARQSGVQRFFKDKVKSLGIRTPVLRKLSQEYVKAHRRSLDLDDALAIGDRLIRCELLEEKAMAVLLAERFAGPAAAGTLRRVRPLDRLRRQLGDDRCDLQHSYRQDRPQEWPTDGRPVGLGRRLQSLAPASGGGVAGCVGQAGGVPGGEPPSGG